MVALKASAPARHSTVERLRTLADEVEKLPHVHLRRAQEWARGRAAGAS